MKGMIIYRSTRGATDQYAKWIAEETGFKLANLDYNYDIVIPSEVKIIVIGSSVKSGRMTIYHWLKKNLNVLIDKKLIFFSVQASRVDAKTSIDIKESSIPMGLIDDCAYFSLRGCMKTEDVVEKPEKKGFFQSLFSRSKPKSRSQKVLSHVEKGSIRELLEAIERKKKDLV